MDIGYIEILILLFFFFLQLNTLETFDWCWDLYMNYNKVKETKTYINIDYQFISISDWIPIYFTLPQILYIYIFNLLYSQLLLIIIWQTFDQIPRKKKPFLLILSNKILWFCKYLIVEAYNIEEKKSVIFLLFSIELIAIDCVLFLFFRDFFLD